MKFLIVKLNKKRYNTQILNKGAKMSDIGVIKSRKFLPKIEIKNALLQLY